MKKVVFLAVVNFIFCFSYGQNTIEGYIKSFPHLNGTDIINTHHIGEKYVKMTKEEALDYVLYGDTTKIYCPDLEYDAWNEKIYGMTIREYLPLKCVRVEYSDCFLICYKYTQCDSNGVWHKSVRTFELYDKNLKKRDSLIVFKGDEHDEYIEGLFNPQTQKIYLYNSELSICILYRVDAKTLKFEEILRYEGDTKVTLNKQMDKLGWTEVFNKEDCE